MDRHKEIIIKNYKKSNYTTLEPQKTRIYMGRIYLHVKAEQL